MQNINLQKKGPKQISDHQHRILHIRNSLGIKFQSNFKILNFWTKSNQKRVFYNLKRKKKDNHHIRISLGPKFQLQQTILIFWTKIAPKRDTSSQKQKK